MQRPKAWCAANCLLGAVVGACKVDCDVLLKVLMWHSQWVARLECAREG